MAITRKQTSTADSIIENTESTSKKIQDFKDAETKKDQSSETSRLNRTKKSNFIFSFIKTTFDEVKKTEWPGYKYVATWSAVVILFTTVFSLVLGSIDHIFGTVVVVVDCTSPEAKNKKIQDCGTEIVDYLTFKKTE